MKSTYLVFVIIAAVCFSAGCGSAPATNTNSGNQTTGVAVNTNSSVSQANTIAPGQPPTGIPGPASTGNSNVDVNAPPAGNIAMADRRRVVDVPQSGPNQPPPAVPAPENSTITTMMAKDGTFGEVRVFNSDKYIAKVEKTANGKKQMARIFLKNGRVVNVNPVSIPELKTAPLSVLMTLAGIKPTPPADQSKNNQMTKKPTE